MSADGWPGPLDAHDVYLYLLRRSRFDEAARLNDLVAEICGGKRFELLTLDHVVEQIGLRSETLRRRWENQRATDGRGHLMNAFLDPRDGQLYVLADAALRQRARWVKVLSGQVDPCDVRTDDEKWSLDHPWERPPDCPHRS